MQAPPSNESVLRQRRATANPAIQDQMPAQVPQAPLEGAPEAPRNLLDRQNPTLLLKLAVIVYFLSQGGSHWRVFLLALCAFVIYLYFIPAPLSYFSANCSFSGTRLELSNYNIYLWYISPGQHPLPMCHQMPHPLLVSTSYPTAKCSPALQ